MSICPVTSLFSFFRNSDEKSRGGIGVYVKDCTNYKVRNDIVSINETLDHLWIEVQGKNKRSPYLIRIVSQPSSRNAKKIIWIEKNQRSAIFDQKRTWKFHYTDRWHKYRLKFYS